MKYKSQARIMRTFYGIDIKPGEVKDFPGPINDPNFKQVDNKSAKSSTKFSKLSKNQSAQISRKMIQEVVDVDEKEE